MPAMSLHGLQTSYEPQDHDKPLPQLPLPSSPTLTNPDMVLPSSANLPLLSTPPRHTNRPPSPSYLRDNSESPTTSPRATMGARKEKLGLMSRKMLLLRSRTGSGAGGQANGSSAFQTPSDYNSFLASSPTLHDVGNLAPEQSEGDHLQPPEEGRRPSASGSSSSDLSALNGFLAKYTKSAGVADDEAYDTETSAPHKNDELDIESDRERQRKEEEEYNSAILSKRAEEILANAKKRLNLMEGNLRGARDLVAPLTAANLKRATSLGSAHYFPAYNRRSELSRDYDAQHQQPRRRLQSQASSPIMGRDYTNHARGFSENELPERPYTSLENGQTPATRQIRAPIRAAEPSWIQGLRGSRSFEVLAGAGGVGQYTVRERPLHAGGSPEPYALEPLQEADESKRVVSNRDSILGQNSDMKYGLGIQERPSSRTSDLREQMTTLRGKISNLKDRAREESLRRQSASQLRTPSPFNNALVSAPEFFYTSSSAYGGSVLNGNAGIGHVPQNGSSVNPEVAFKKWEESQTFVGSPNAFANQPAQEDKTQTAQLAETKDTALSAPQSERQSSADLESATIQSAQNRIGIAQSADYACRDHQQNEAEPSIVAKHMQEERPVQDSESDSGSETPGASPLSSDVDDESGDEGDAKSEDNISIYEDAHDDSSPAVAHEDRDDAFDYEHFFLHSSMGTYGNRRRGSESSGTSVSSGETARGPTQAAANGYDDEGAEEEYEGDYEEDFYANSGMYPPPTPETPERLREIERNLHKRVYSSESISTINTFATADEGPMSPMEYAHEKLRPTSRGSRPSSRPGTAIKRPIPVRRDSSSERADSGVGLGRHSTGSDSKRPPPGILTSKASTINRGSVGTPPLSPRGVQDPATLAVNAILDPYGKPLGLRNKAVLFSVVESLRKVVRTLQEDEAQGDNQALRRRLEEAKSLLEGRDER